MRLNTALNTPLTEAGSLGWIAILEDGEGPRLRFDYARFKHDPTPDLLLLGSYTHPNTGNDLVGGINIHYLDKNQILSLAKVLPKIMQGGNLYGRYWEGRRLLPDVFNNYYRTYNTDYINNMDKGVMYPKYGFTKTAADWIKKKIGGLFKSKKQREQAALPKYPEDISDVQSRLDAAVERARQAASLQAQERPQEPQKPEQFSPDELQKARAEYDQEFAKHAERLENQPLDQNREYDQTQETQQQPLQQQAPAQPIRPQQPDPITQLQQDRQENKEELEDPDNNLDLSESYYSPVTRSWHYI